jgi:acyl carrier protein
MAELPRGESHTTSEELIRSVALRIIGSIAPEASIDEIEPRRMLRDQFQFDSVDFLNFALALEKELSIRIPEFDYPMLGTLDGCIEYIRSRIGPGSLAAQL